MEVVPADYAVPDQPVAGLGDLLLLPFGLRELAGIPDGDGTGEAVGEFGLAELPLDCLAQREVVCIAQDEEGLHDLAEGLEGLLERALAGMGIEAAEDVGRGVFLELDRGDQAQDRRAPPDPPDPADAASPASIVRDRSGRRPLAGTCRTARD